MAEAPKTPEVIRHRIIEAVSQMIREKGIKPFTMDDVAHQLRMSKRTLYQIFTDKEEILLACVDEELRNEREIILQIVSEADNVLDAILLTFEHKMRRIGSVRLELLGDLKRYPRIMAYLDEKHRAETTDSAAFMEKGVEQGVFRGDVNFSVVHEMIDTAVRGIMGNSAFSSMSFRELFKQTALIVLRGCTTPKGTALLDEFLAKWKD